MENKDSDQQSPNPAKPRLTTLQSILRGALGGVLGIAALGLSVMWFEVKDLRREMNALSHRVNSLEEKPSPERK